MEIQLGALYQELIQKLRAAEIATAELRGQVQLCERLIEQSQQPILSGDPLGEQSPVNGAPQP